MPQTNDLRGYALKQRLGLVPHIYPAADRMRGVQPPVTFAEGRRHQAEAAARATGRAPTAGPGGRPPAARPRGGA